MAGVFGSFKEVISTIFIFSLISFVFGFCVGRKSVDTTTSPQTVTSNNPDTSKTKTISDDVLADVDDDNPFHKLKNVTTPIPKSKNTFEAPPPGPSQIEIPPPGPSQKIQPNLSPTTKTATPSAFDNLESKESSSEKRPKQTITLMLCPQSQLRATDACPIKSPETFPLGQEPKDYCNLHH